MKCSTSDLFKHCATTALAYGTTPLDVFEMLEEVGGCIPGLRVDFLQEWNKHKHEYKWRFPRELPEYGERR